MQPIPHLHDLIENLSDPVRVDLFALARERQLPKNETIYRQGEEPREWFKIVSGSVKLCTYTPGGREMVPLELHDGDCFGEMGMIDGLPRVSHAIAMTDLTILVWKRSDFEALCAKYSEFKDSLMRMLALRTRLAYCMLIESRGLSLRERLAVALCRLAYSSPGTASESDIPISQEGLGQMLGASRQTVNKELQQLATAQLISLNYGKIRVIDLPELERRYGELAGTDSVAAVYGAQ